MGQILLSSAEGSWDIGEPGRKHLFNSCFSIELVCWKFLDESDRSARCINREAITPPGLPGPNVTIQ